MFAFFFFSLSRLVQAAISAEQPQIVAADPQRRVPGYLRPVAARGHQPVPPDVSGTVKRRLNCPLCCGSKASWLRREQLGRNSNYLYTT